MILSQQFLSITSVTVYITLTSPQFLSISLVTVYITLTSSQVLSIILIIVYITLTSPQFLSITLITVYITYLDSKKGFYRLCILFEYNVDLAEAQCSLQIDHNPWVRVRAGRHVCIAVVMRSRSIGIHQFPIRKLLR